MSTLAHAHPEMHCKLNRTQPLAQPVEVHRVVQAAPQTSRELPNRFGSEILEQLLQIDNDVTILQKLPISTSLDGLFKVPGFCGPGVLLTWENS